MYTLFEIWRLGKVITFCSALFGVKYTKVGDMGGFCSGCEGMKNEVVKSGWKHFLHVVSLILI